LRALSLYQNVEQLNTPLNIILKLSLCACLCLTTAIGYAQSENEQVIDAKRGSRATKIQKQTNKLKKAYDNNDEYEIAAAYELIGNEYFQNSDYVQAEINFAKARDGFDKLGKKDELARCLRSLAKSQEAQKRGADAQFNFSQASNSLPPSRKTERDLNDNDAARLKEASPATQENLIQENIGLAKLDGAKEDEVAAGYGQLGDINLAQNKVPEAAANYQNAVNASPTIDDAIKYSNQLSEVYSNAGQFDQAITVQKQLLARNDLKESVSGQIAIIQNLATIYSDKQSDPEAYQLYLQSYQLAMAEFRTLDAKAGLEGMIEIERKRGNTQKCIELYRQFLIALDSLLPADPSLVDVKMMEATADKIAQLEQEKALKDQLIERKNRFNLALMIASVLFAALSVLIAFSWLAIRRKNKRIALQSLRREMNPHFIFNSLNSINQFIAQNNELAANKYLTSYSQLMRTMMENSNKDFVPLHIELNMLRKYLELEKQRFPEKFDYQIVIDEAIDQEGVEIPNMLIQPHLENAIWHGLRYLENSGKLDLRIQKIGQNMRIEIEDNGIGLSKSKQLKTVNQKAYTSRGMNNTLERIALLNKLYHHRIECKIAEKLSPEMGTLITIQYRLK
jgi:two-component system, sensor histidine kinase YesM